MEHLATAKLLDAYRGQIVNQTVAMALQDSYWQERFGPGIGERLALDFDLNLANLAKAIRYRSPMILDDHVIWRRSQILGFGCSTGHLRTMFGYKWSAICSLMPPETHQTIYDYFQSAMGVLSYQQQAAQQIGAAQEALAGAVVAATYDSIWHWQAAYGPQGRDRLTQDTWYLLDYAVDSIGNRSPDLLGRHVRYRRDKNLAIGLSTIHMQQLLWLATQAAEAHLAPAAAQELHRALESAAGYLQPESEGCSALAAVQDQVVSEVAAELSYAGLAPQPEQAAIEIGWYLAYLNDSMAGHDPSNLVNFTRWMQHWFANQGLPDTPLHQSLHALSNSLARHLPQYAAQDARSILSAAQQAL